jgi:predicted N-formylglutamate amidohydrolase
VGQLHAARVAGVGSRSKRKDAPSSRLVTLAIGEAAAAQFRTLQVGEDRDGAADILFHLPDRGVAGADLVMAAMAHVQAEHIGPRLVELADHVVAFGRGPEGRDDLDPGAAGVTGYLADALQAPAILSDFSRLVIDPNRGTDDPTLVMQVYDGTVIPGNRGIDAAEIAARRALCYDPYHRALADLAGARADRVLVAIHSFTPQMRGGAPRPWEIGILHGKDARLALPLLDLLRAEGDLCVGENEPYGGHLDGDSIDKHALAAGRPNVLIELRNDVIRTAGQQAAWAARLAPMIRRVLDQSGL